MRSQKKTRVGEEIGLAAAFTHGGLIYEWNMFLLTGRWSRGLLLERG